MVPSRPSERTRRRISDRISGVILLPASICLVSEKLCQLFQCTKELCTDLPKDHVQFIQGVGSVASDCDQYHLQHCDCNLRWTSYGAMRYNFCFCTKHVCPVEYGSDTSLRRQMCHLHQICKRGCVVPVKGSLNW